MSRKRDSLSVRLLAYIASMILVMGLIPLPALAEAANTLAGDQPSAESESAAEHGPNGESETDTETDTQAETGESNAPGGDQPESEEPADSGTADESEGGTTSEADDDAAKEGADDATDRSTDGTDPAQDAPDSASMEEGEDTPAFEGEQLVDDVKVSVKAAAGVFPADATLSVERAGEDVKAQADAAVAEVRGEGRNVAVSHTLDIKVIDAQGNEVQPAEGKDVIVSFTLAEVADQNLEASVYHLTEREGSAEPPASIEVESQTPQGMFVAQQLETEVAGEDGRTLVVESEGLSLYTVEFTYAELSYVLKGVGRVSLADVLNLVGLSGEPEAVRVSNESLLSVANEAGAWVLTVHQAFSSEEWALVTIRGVEYKVAVTNDIAEADEAADKAKAAKTNGLALQAQADIKGVRYIERSWDGTKVVAQDKSRNVTPVPDDGGMTEGWYYLNKDVKVDGRICLTGNTDLILGAGKTLDVKGIYIPKGSTLAVYSQVGDTGKINSHPSGGAAIGAYSGHEGGSVVVHGGVIIANGASHCAGIGSNDGNGTTASINIYGGTVTATGGGGGAGIGGGRYCDGGAITIYGGDVTAKGGGSNGAGIGGGDDGDGGTITINGGDVTCHGNGSGQGARIGGGCDGDGGTTTINGGTIHVYFRDGAGIGGGENGDGGTILISGGYVESSREPGSSGNGAAIGGGNHSGAGGEITITGGEVHANGIHGAGIGGGRAKNGDSHIDLHIMRADTDTVPAGDGGTITISGGTVYAESRNGFGMGSGGQQGNLPFDADGAYLRMGNVDQITIKGDAHVTAEGRPAGIGGVRGSVHIQENADVTLTGNKYHEFGLGILLSNTTLSSLEVTGGKLYVESLGATEALCAYGNVSITGGTVIATSPSYRATCEFHSFKYYKNALIKAGKSESEAKALKASERGKVHKQKHKYVSISPCDHQGLMGDDGVCSACGYSSLGHETFVERSWDGTEVTGETKSVPDDAYPFPESADTILTPGWYFVGKDVKRDGRVNLTGDTHLVLGDGHTLDVKGIYVPEGKTLYVYGQDDDSGKLKSSSSGGAAIGAYSGHKGGNVVIHGGTVEAIGADHCAGIGSNDGDKADVGSFTMYGGTVTATGGSDGAGIGGGRDSDGGTITIYSGTVTATGKDSSAGIGGGDPSGSRADNSTINIYGGTVTATGKSKGAGIGGGEYGHATITISGGTVTATGGPSGGAGIGSGADGVGSTVTVTGGTVNATASNGGYGIGNGKNKKGTTSTVTLGYTDSTRDDVSIKASSYDGKVTLDQLFYNASGLYQTGVQTDLSRLGGSALRAWDGKEAITWSQLQAVINNTSDGGTIKLERDYTAADDDIALQVVGRSITIDLNGHNLNRGLGEAEEPEKDGSVLYVKAGSSLTIEDSGDGGTITGGFNSGSGGGVYCEGTLTINGGTISKNAATAWGGGVYLSDKTNATLNLNGGAIMGNGCGNNGGAVHVSGSATITVSGDPVVTSNMKGEGESGSNNDIKLTGNARIQVKGELGENANLWVSAANATGIITTGYSAHNTELPSKVFHADHDGYAVVLSSGEARIDSPVSGETYFDAKLVDGKLQRSWKYTDNEWIAFPNVKSIPSGKYVLNRDITVKDRVSLEGDTWLVLTDGYTLDVRGLYVPKGATLTVYGQEKDSGKIVSNPSGGAAIGAYSGHKGGNVVVHGGTVEATGHAHCAGIGSNDGDGADVGSFTMYGGYVTATGGSQGAGIGGGRGSDGGTVTIYGGNVTATGKDSSAGIGGGDPSDSRADNSTISIYGGTVTATGKSKGAGIGGGEYGHATVTISGGSVTATGGPSGGAGIGSGADGVGSTVTITGGTIKATASNGGYGIGDGKSKKGTTSTVTLGSTDTTKQDICITSTSYSGTVTMKCDFKKDVTDELFLVGTVSNNDALKDSTLRVWDGQFTSWRVLKNYITVAPGDTVDIRLTQDLKAKWDDNGIEIPVGKTVTIDLNGHTLDVNNPSGGRVKVVRQVIVNRGTLTIKDSQDGGKITGGYPTAWQHKYNGAVGHGGGIYNAKGATLYLEGGTISGNKTAQDFLADRDTAGRGGGVYNAGTMVMSGGAIKENIAYVSTLDGKYVGHGGGIFNEVGATLTITGGEISGNIAEERGAGIENLGTLYLYGGRIVNNKTSQESYYNDKRGDTKSRALYGGIAQFGTMYVHGSPVVEGNTGKGADNIWLPKGKLLLVDGPLGDGAHLDVTLEGKKGVVTKGYSDDNAGADPSRFLTSAGYAAILNGDGEAELVDAPVFRTHSLLLDGAIGVRFFMELPKLKGVDWTQSSMEFAVSGRGAKTTVDPFDPEDTNAAGTYYAFTCYVSSIQMADTITATFHYVDGGKERSISQDYSIAQYVTDFEKVASSFDEETVNLVHAMADYGHYVQPHLSSVNGWKIGTDYAEMPSVTTFTPEMVEEARERVEEYDISSELPEGGEIERVGMGLNLTSSTDAYISLTLRKGASISSAKLADGTNLQTWKAPNGNIRVTIPGIMAHHLADMFDITIETSGGTTAKVRVAAVTFTRAVLEADKYRDNEAAQYMATCLWRYWEAADSYMKAHPEQ